MAKKLDEGKDVTKPPKKKNLENKAVIKEEKKNGKKR
jgi:hypothetical protein